MPSPLDPATSTILIVGGGTWGSSTALHLARRGYRHVTVLDAHAVPSAISAGNDINKIVEQASLPTPTDPAPTTVTNTLLAAAAAAWRSDPVFAPHHHPTGYILAASSPAALAALRAREQPSPANGFAPLESAAHFRAAMTPAVLTGALPGWRGWLKRDGAGGFFMEPDEDNHELKICDEHPGYLNWTTDPKTGRMVSLPFAKNQIPLEAERRVREFLQECMPHLAQRPFSFARICWCADTPDRAFLITPHPEWKSLVLGVGGSGHGFMHMPIIGGYIADAMEGKLEDMMRRTWRWRPETAVGRDWKDTQGRFGGGNVVMDFQDVKENEWTTIPSNSKL
ncbi:hypothetical protein SLS56_012227 [Neofusicoccum ribis]|uniref:FAD dependent oxidoreductase domain-containing protein n=1 Tax=Neofusicoccum ribis TaxID=45134 RepID=A0ABR3SAH1_9PEZI